MTCLPRAGSRHAGEKKASSANKQYRRADSARSIVVSFRCLGALGCGLGHYFFDFRGSAGLAPPQELLTSTRELELSFNSDPTGFFRGIDTWFHGDLPARF